MYIYIYHTICTYVKPYVYIRNRGHTMTPRQCSNSPRNAHASIANALTCSGVRYLGVSLHLDETLLTWRHTDFSAHMDRRKERARLHRECAHLESEKRLHHLVQHKQLLRERGGACSLPEVAGTTRSAATTHITSPVTSEVTQHCSCASTLPCNTRYYASIANALTWRHIEREFFIDNLLV